MAAATAAPAAPAAQILKGVAAQPKTVEEWAKAKQKYPAIFGYTADGDLAVPAVRPGDQARTIILKPYEAQTKAGVEEFYKARLEATKEPAEQYAAAKRALAQLLSSYKANPGSVTDYDILVANQQVHDAECLLNNPIKAPRYIVRMDGLPTQDLTLDWYDRTKNPNPVCMAGYTLFPESAFWKEAAFAPVGQPAVVEPPPIGAEQRLEEEEAGVATGEPKASRAPLSPAALAIIRKRKAAKAAGGP